jgi:hypothetical protein
MSIGRDSVHLETIELKHACGCGGTGGSGP